jgi:acetylornithine deacetylase/succinyl-diaminopimelate desuccinylase-like protein
VKGCSIRPKVVVATPPSDFLTTAKICRRLCIAGVLALCLSGSPLFAQAGLIDWAKAQDEAVGILQDLIRLDTSNPPGREILAAQQLKRIFDESGIESSVYESAPGRGNIVARLRGDGSKRPVLLLGHLDVVGVERDHWTVDPFGGEIKGGRLYGRGAADMKSLVAAEVMTLLLFKRSAIPLHRDLIFAGVADEESSSEYGIQYLILKHWPEIEAEFSFNEGGRIESSPRTGKVDWVGIQTTEKRPYNLRIIARGTSAHASLETPDNPIHTLAQALARLSEYQPPLKLNETTRKYVEEIGQLEHLPGDWYKESHKVRSGGWPDAHGEGTVQSLALYATLHDTLSPTVLAGGYRSNVIPAEAEVNLNCRLLPDTDIGEFIEAIRKVIHEEKVEIKYQSDSRPRTSPTPYTTAAFRAYEGVVKKTLGEAIPLIPIMGTGATDSSFLRARGMASYGIDPFVEDHPSNAHGNDESISLKGYRDGVMFLFEVIERLQ